MVELNLIVKLIGNYVHNDRPFQVPEGVFDKTRLISEEEYKKRLDAGELKRNRIHPKYQI